MRKKELRRQLRRLMAELEELGFAVQHLTALSDHPAELHAFGKCSTCDRLGKYVEQPGRPPTIRFSSFVNVWSLPGEDSLDAAARHFAGEDVEAARERVR